jgi:heat shock protein HslJ
VLAVTAAACSDDGSGGGGGNGHGGADGGGSSGSGSAAPLTGTNWVLSPETDLGVTLEGVTVSARFDRTEVSGEGGCNTYRAPYTLDGSSMRIGPDIATTLIGCDGPEASVERVYLRRLPQVRSYVIVRSRLTLRDDDGDPLLVYEASGVEHLDGEWIVTGYYTGDAVQSPLAGTELTAAFDGAQVSGTTGCNSFGGSVETSADDIAIGPLTQTLIGCPSAAIQQQETDYLAALELASTFLVTGDRLELFRADGGFAVTFIRAA